MIKLTHVKKSILLFILSNLATTPEIYAGDTPSVEGTKIYFVNIQDGDVVKNNLMNDKSDILVFGIGVFIFIAFLQIKFILFMNKS